MTGPGRYPGGESALRDLQELLDAYGANKAHWPVGDRRRAAAWALLQSGDDAAARMVADAMALDHVLDAASPPLPSAALTGAILQAAEKQSRWRFQDWTMRMWKPAGALACAAFLGVMVGVYSPVPVGSVTAQTANLETELASLGSVAGNGFGELAE